MNKKSAIVTLFTAAAAVVMLAPSAEAVQCVKGVASWDRLNVRSGPSARYPIVFSLGPTQCGISRPRSCRGNWCKITFRGRTGWANHRYLYVDEGGDGDLSPPRRTKRFFSPRLYGMRVDSRISRYASFTMPATAHSFCRAKGYGGMVNYRVATAYQTIGMVDRHVFYNNPRSNTTYRFITCR